MLTVFFKVYIVWILSGLLILFTDVDNRLGFFHSEESLNAMFTHSVSNLTDTQSKALFYSL